MATTLACISHTLPRETRAGKSGKGERHRFQSPDSIQLAVRFDPGTGGKLCRSQNTTDCNHGTVAHVVASRLLQYKTSSCAAGRSLKAWRLACFPAPLTPKRFPAGEGMVCALSVRCCLMIFRNAAPVAVMTDDMPMVRLWIPHANVAAFPSSII